MVALVSGLVRNRLAYDLPTNTNIQFRHARMMQLVNNAECRMGMEKNLKFEDKSIPVLMS